MAGGVPPLVRFLDSLGFEDNPFLFTNADDEPRLGDYFVPPPYFASVYGDPRTPTSSMVFAPRGAGKSAQRRMVEIQAPADQVLCVTYDTFRNPSGRPLTQMSISDHASNVARIVLVGLLTWLAERPQSANQLAPEQRLTLATLARAVLSGVTRAELQVALSSLRNLSETAKDIWNKHNWVLNAVLSSINVAMGGPGGGTLPAAPAAEVSDVAPEEHLDLLGRLASALGLQAIYVLIDRVDETAETTADPTAAYKMMQPLMHELKLLESRPFAFKFFLPDALLPPYEAAGARSDRIRNYETVWNNKELETMMSKRLLAHSATKVSQLGDILDPAISPEDSTNLQNLVLLFAHRSPRDYIRIWGRVVDEQLRMDPSAEHIGAHAVWAGIDSFSFERADEIAGSPVVKQLTRVGRADFTVTELASDVLHVHTNSARAKIQQWERRGVIRQVGEVSAAHGRPHHHYAVVDVRIARAMFPDLDLQEFLARKTRICKSCGSWALRDWDDQDGAEPRCAECGVAGR